MPDCSPGFRGNGTFLLLFLSNLRRCTSYHSTAYRKLALPGTQKTGPDRICTGGDRPPLGVFHHISLAEGARIPFQLEMGKIFGERRPQRTTTPEMIPTGCLPEWVHSLFLSFRSKVWAEEKFRKILRLISVSMEGSLCYFLLFGMFS